MPSNRRTPSIPHHFRIDQDDPEISVVIPVFEEEDVFPTLIARLSSALDDLGLTAEVILIDDGSTDGTFRAIEQAHLADPRIRAIGLSRNFGHQAAISAGLAEARGESVVVMDGDLQDPPEAIGLLWAKLSEGYDVVYAIRASRPEGLVKRLAYATFYRFFRRSVSIAVPLDAGDFGIISRRVLDVLNELPERRRFVRGLRAWAGFRQVGLAIDREPRAGGRPKYTWSKLLGLAIDGLVGFSEAPLRWAGALGLLAIGTAACGAAGLLVAGASSWAWIALLVIFFGGAQLLSTAVLGEYVTRTLHETRGRPAYVVRRRIGFPPTDAPPQPLRVQPRRVRYRG